MESLEVVCRLLMLWQLSVSLEVEDPPPGQGRAPEASERPEAGLEAGESAGPSGESRLGWRAVGAWGPPSREGLLLESGVPGLPGVLALLPAFAPNNLESEERELTTAANYCR